MVKNIKVTFLSLCVFVISVQAQTVLAQIKSSLLIDSALREKVSVVEINKELFIEEKSIRVSNPKPASLVLQRVDEKVAVIMASFPHQKPGTKVAISLGEKDVVLSDAGDNGDGRAKDGIFSLKTEFDFETFAKANAMLAELKSQKKQNLSFSSSSRQITGEQILVEQGSSLLLRSSSTEKSRELVLPLESKAIEVGRKIELPANGLVLGLPPVFSPPASIPHSLMITDTNVVEDSNRTWACPTAGTSPVGDATGEWTFWQLMANINNGTSSTSDYIKAMFAHWNSDQNINGDIVADRSNVYQQVIEQWELRSGGPGAELLPEQSPFRLLGIVLRVDLRSNGSIYSGGDAGEGRFVFALHDGNCNPMSKTIILEYRVPVAGCKNVRAWAQDWKDLQFSTNYNDDLAALTRVFSDADANPSAANGSAISQVRSNEFLAGSPMWELREFVLPSGGGFMHETTVKQEPARQHNNTALLADYINNSWQALVGPPPGQHEISLQHAGVDFLGGKALAPTTWNAPAAALTVPTTPSPISPAPATIRDDALFQLAVNTCSGCHLSETQTGFAHLHYNTPPGAAAILSGFLQGISIPDAREPAVMRNFNDLARRASDLDDVASLSCLSIGKVALGNIVLHELTSPVTLKASH